MPAPSRTRRYGGGITGVSSGADLRVISKQLRRMNDKEITRRFRAELRAVAQPLVPVVRQAALDIPVNGESGSTGLRGRLSKSVHLNVRTTGRRAGVSIQADAKRMPSGQKALPAYMEGTKPRWRHPVFGREDDPWAQQDAHPWFYPALKSLGVRGRAGVQAVVDSITRDITLK
jgi:hypothetical protein